MTPTPENVEAARPISIRRTYRGGKDDMFTYALTRPSTSYLEDVLSDVSKGRFLRVTFGLANGQTVIIRPKGGVK